MILQIADVHKLRCDFVSKMINYINCTNYSIDCCDDDVVNSYLLYKIASSSCDIPYELYCSVTSSIPSTDFYVDCDDYTPTPCSSQIGIQLSSNITTDTYTSKLENPINGSAFPALDLQADSITQRFVIELNTYKNGTTLYDSHKLYSGSYNGTLGLDTNVHFKVGNGEKLTAVKTISSGYILTLQLPFTDVDGNHDPSTDYFLINASPLSSPYLTCAGCPHTVTASHLYFSHASYTTALKNLIENAVYNHCGEVAVDVEVKYGGNDLYIIFYCKHIPSSYHYGHDGLYPSIIYYGGATTQFGTLYYAYKQAGMYNQYSLELPCKTEVLETPNQYHVANHPKSKFNELSFFSLYANTPTILTGDLVNTCSSLTLSATLSHSVYTSVRWINPASATISTSLSTVVDPYVGGTYTFEVTLPNGCVVTDTIEV